MPSCRTFSMSRAPISRSSVVESGRFTTRIFRLWDFNSLLDFMRVRHSAHRNSFRDGLHPKRQSSTTLTSGSKSARALTTVVFPVPFGPEMRTPPIRGLTPFRTRASLRRSRPTIDVNGSTDLFSSLTGFPVLFDAACWKVKDTNKAARSRTSGSIE